MPLFTPLAARSQYSEEFREKLAEFVLCRPADFQHVFMGKLFVRDARSQVADARNAGDPGGFLRKLSQKSYKLAESAKK